ncbi:hypothetical protein [Costertonia aggregata]|uniref:PorT family protein n=1 Tax=Costertonia aggregata TaxID=343403 RepID=A0A7H9AKG7_9FLAO|nr:hypothetical protein [Costertonia aggregata]QLG43961.1 hypothetical protein HYG79_00885 [Costertonia aggregata]
MMRILFFAVLFMLISQISSAQQNEREQTISLLRQQIKSIEKEEKEALRKQVEDINSLLENGVLDVEAANNLKLKAAQERSRRITDRKSVLLKTIAFLEKSEENQKSDNVEIFLDVDTYSKENEGIQMSLTNISTNTPNNTSPVQKTQQDQQNVIVKNPTTLDLVFATGLNNTISDGISWQDIEDELDYEFYSSRFLEIGLALKTPLFKKNGIRLKYGLSLQWNELESNGNRFFGVTDNQTALQEFPSLLRESNFVMTNLVVPVQLEFGPTKKKRNHKNTYYSSSNQFKIGVGGYVGINLRTRQRLEYTSIAGQRRFYVAEVIDDYQVNNQIYGLSGYVGIGAFSLYGKYDLNSIFENGVKDEQFVSVGIRLDL